MQQQVHCRLPERRQYSLGSEMLEGVSGWLRRWSPAYISGIIAYCFLRYAGFSDRQGAVLAIGVAALYFPVHFLTKEHKETVGFRPFRIVVGLIWTRLGELDLPGVSSGVANLRKEHERLQSQIDDEDRKKRVEVPAGDGYHVLRDGISISVLGPNLYFSDNHHSFMSAFGANEEIPEFETPGQIWCRPSFYVREHSMRGQADYGLVIGLYTYEAPDGHVNLAFLPAAFLGEHYGWNRTTRKERKRLDEAMRRYSWEVRAEGEAVLHRYVSIVHRSL
jgi:hypothetical protein